VSVCLTERRFRSDSFIIIIIIDSKFFKFQKKICKKIFFGQKVILDQIWGKKLKKKICQKLHFEFFF